jgi:hypothetical protein
LTQRPTDPIPFLFMLQADYKPSSVPHTPGGAQSGDHSSRPRVSPWLKQPTRKPGRAVPDARRRRVSLFGLAPCGVCQADPLPDRWCALTAPFQPCLSLSAIGGMFSVALSVPFGPSSYEAHCPAELGLSSSNLRPKRSPVCLQTESGYAFNCAIASTNSRAPVAAANENACLPRSPDA